MNKLFAGPYICAPHLKGGVCWSSKALLFPSPVVFSIFFFFLLFFISWPWFSQTGSEAFGCISINKQRSILLQVYKLLCFLVRGHQNRIEDATSITSIFSTFSSLHYFTFFWYWLRFFNLFFCALFRHVWHASVIAQYQLKKKKTSRSFWFYHLLFTLIFSLRAQRKEGGERNLIFIKQHRRHFQAFITVTVICCATFIFFICTFEARFFFCTSPFSFSTPLSDCSRHNLSGCFLKAVKKKKKTVFFWYPRDIHQKQVLISDLGQLPALSVTSLSTLLTLHELRFHTLFFLFPFRQLSQLTFN